MKNPKKLGSIVAGSLLEGLVMRLAPTYPLEEIKTGKFACVRGSNYTFFSLITDLELEVTNQDIVLFPPGPQENLLSSMLRKRDIYANVKLRPLLMMAKNDSPGLTRGPAVWRPSRSQRDPGSVAGVTDRSV